jgi:hypothetical protein
MTGQKQSIGRRDRKMAKLYAMFGVFLLLVLAFVSDRSRFLNEREPARMDQSRSFKDAAGQQHFVYVFKTDPAIEGSLAEIRALTLRMVRNLAYGELFFSVCAFSFLALHFQTTRLTLRAHEKEGWEGENSPQAAGVPLRGRWIGRVLVGIGLVSVVMALAVAILWSEIVWLDWRRGLEDISGRAQSVLLSKLAARTALISGICSLMFFPFSFQKLAHSALGTPTHA